ncbi:hypothetical protein [Halorussus salinus]|nr:hypothetical protein [Halorussus salinus]
MATEQDVDSSEDPTLGNGDDLSERVEKIDVESEETCDTDEMRELLDL